MIDEATHAESTRIQIEGIARFYARYMIEERGRRTLAEVTQFDLAEYFDMLKRIPTRYGQSAQQREMSFGNLIALGQRMGSAAAADAIARAKRETAMGDNRAIDLETEAIRARAKVVGLSVRSRNKHVSHINTILTTLEAKGYDVGAACPTKLRTRNRRTTARKEAPKPDIDTLRALFEIPVYSGFESEKVQHAPGTLRAMSGAFYAPLLLYYTGARRNEIAGLALDDVRIEGVDIPFMTIAENASRSTKTPYSHRTVPIPRQVLALGFEDYVSKIRSIGDKRLFPISSARSGSAIPATDFTTS